MRAYVAPRVLDHGRLRDLTAATHLLLAGAGDPAGARDLTFSGTSSPVVGGATTSNAQEAQEAQPTTVALQGGDAGTPSANGGEVASGEATGSGDGPGPGSGGGSGSGGAEASGDGAGSGSGSGSGPGGEPGSGGNLPFTGLAAGVLGAIGSGMIAAGAGMRRALRRGH